MKFGYLLSLTSLLLCVACGGGSGSETHTVPVKPPVASPPPSAPAVSRVVPMLLQGSYAPYEVGGYVLTSLSFETGAYTDLAERSCQGRVSFAQNKATGKTEIHCAESGSAFHLDTEKLELTPVVALPKSPSFAANVACADDGTCYYGLGNYNFAALPSNAALCVVGRDDRLIERLVFPDYVENAVPVKIGMIRDGAGKEKLIAVTETYAGEVVIHRFDVATRRFEAYARFSIDQTAVAIGDSSIVLGVHRGIDSNAYDAIVVDPATLALKGTLRTSLVTPGIPSIRAIMISRDAIFLAGGYEFEGYGVWRFDSQTFSRLATAIEPSLPFSGAYDSERKSLWVARETGIEELDEVSLEPRSVHPRTLPGGDMFLVPR